MPDDNNDTSRPGPVEVRIHRSEAPPVDVSLDPSIGLPFDAPIDVPLDQPEPIEPIVEPEPPVPQPAIRSFEPPVDQAPRKQIVRSEPPIVVPVAPREDRSYPRFGHSAEAEGAAASERSSSRWVGILVALVIGALGGYAAGLMVAQRERPPQVVEEPPAEVTPQGQSFTESSVPVTPAPPEPVEAPEPKSVDAARAPAETKVGGLESQPTPAVRDVTGSLLVRSVPSGARVLVNGTPRGVTPLALRSLALGSHNVEVTYLGYTPRQMRVALTTERPAQSIDFELRAVDAAAAAAAGRAIPADTPGALRVVSRPSGARVFVDNQAVGVTPLVLSGVRAGSHAVRLEMDGYRSWSTSVNVGAGASARVAASLEAREIR